MSFLHRVTAGSTQRPQSWRGRVTGHQGSPQGMGKGDAPSVWSQPWVPSFSPRCHTGLDYFTTQEHGQSIFLSGKTFPLAAESSQDWLYFLAFVLLCSPCGGYSCVYWTWGCTCLSSMLRSVRSKVSSCANTCVVVVWREKQLWGKQWTSTSSILCAACKGPSDVFPAYTSMCFFFSRDMACSVAGITSDANVLTNELRLIAQRYTHKYRNRWCIS